uniref:Ig-like domain-containing protein n=1 Tax=Salarias fasciatus TaxID=181472 RepID=A0A672H9M5_SALFA
SSSDLKFKSSSSCGFQTCLKEIVLKSLTTGFTQCDSGSEAYFGSGTKLTVLDSALDVTPPTVKILKPSPYQGEKRKTLVCVASDFYPDHVSVIWKVNDEERRYDVVTDSEATWGNSSAKWGNGSYTITSRLTVPAKEWHNRAKKFTCEVHFFDGKETIPYPETIYGVKGDDRPRQKYLKITQSAKLTYGALIAKGFIYGAFVLFLLWKLQRSSGKQ